MEREPGLVGVQRAAQILEDVVAVSPLQYSEFLSEHFGAEIWLKREDLQSVRSYKLRGAYNFLHHTTAEQKEQGAVCASAGNHAQGFAFACHKLGILGTVVMPATTPKQKVQQVKYIGKDSVKVILHGDTYDDSKDYAMELCDANDQVFVSPFDHPLIIEGQATVGMEILDQCTDVPPDVVVVPVGGGGLSAGCSLYIKSRHPEVEIYGAEPLGAPAMKRSIEAGSIIRLDEIDSFVDGAAVRKVGRYTFPICQKYLKDVILVPEGRICTYILELYNRAAIVAEPAGILSIAALDSLKEEIQGKKVVCVISGGNNDINRMPLIKEKSLLYEGLKHYFVITFPQRSGALKEFVSEVLGPDDDITLFEYTKKNSKETGPALVGIELRRKQDYQGLVKRLDEHQMKFTLVNEDPVLFNYLI